MRLSTPLAIALLAAVLLAGCGSSSDSTSGDSTAPAAESTAPAGASAQSCETQAVDADELRATGVSCGKALQLLFAWQRQADCATPKGASRSGCSIDSYRCLSAVTDRGVAVSCSRPGRSIAFIAKRG